VYTVNGLSPAVSSSLHHTSTLTVTSTSTGGKPAATGSTSGNSGVVFTVSSLYLFLLFVAGIVVVAI